MMTTILIFPFLAVDVKTTNSCTSDYEVTLLPSVTATSPDAQELTSSKVELTTLKSKSSRNEID